MGNEILEMQTFAKDLVVEAGNKALSFYGKGDRERKFDTSVITSVGLSITDFFTSRISGRFPSHRVFQKSTESVHYTHDQSKHLWVFDPLDGAANIQAGIPIWAISLSLFDNFWPVMGMCTMPATGDLFHASAGSSAFRGETAIRVSTRETLNDESLLLTFSRFHQRYRTRFPGKILNFGCTAAHLCYVAMGRADAAIIANESFEDLAAVCIILEAAGGKIYKMDGAEISINDYLSGDKIEDHLLVTTPVLFPRVRECLERIQ
jgi:myo-inositol-1(or 4)-monophosphatase